MSGRFSIKDLPVCDIPDMLEGMMAGMTSTVNHMKDTLSNLAEQVSSSYYTGRYLKKPAV